ncbi:MAG: SpoIID/LytB domain-containing protein [Elusimicrobiota bacterium]
MGFIFRVAIVAAAGILAGQRLLAPTHTVSPSPQNNVLEGNALYYDGRPRKAVEAYAQALKVDARSLNARLNGAVVLSDLGEHETAVIWFEQAARLSPRDADIRTALAEALRTRGRRKEARAEAERALAIDPQHIYALTALGRIELDDGNPKAAAAALSRAAHIDPNFTLAHFYLGRARESLGDVDGALEAYKIAAFKDSYFTNARYHMSRVLYRLQRFHEAYDQTAKLLASAPVHTKYRKLAGALREKLRHPHRPAPAAHADNSELRSTRRSATPLIPPPAGQVPSLRIGIGTDGMGKPRPWDGLQFTVKTPFHIVSADSGASLVRGEPGQGWRVAVTPQRDIEVYDPSGRRRVRTRSPLRIRPDERHGGWTYLKEPAAVRQGLARTLRGEIEFALHPGKRALKIVNIVDLESYTQGVLTAEMPIRSPMEALKAQAVIARTHALFVKNRRPRHNRDGYELCDGQHCQVYYGVGSETEKSRAVVKATQGRIVTHSGHVAEMLYSSNCGGHSQSSGELKGWTSISYFTGVQDADSVVEVPSSPWELRRWLRSTPKAYCRPSAYVYPSHYRWGRVIPAPEMEKRINRSVDIGRLQGILPLKRSSSGHLNSVLVRGSRGSRVVDNELSIRGLFGIGSQRSALFIMETEYDDDGRPKNFIFYGGGWGHGVGMCQSGAMGRAERGQSYAQILKAYYRGVEIGNLRY